MQRTLTNTDIEMYPCEIKPYLSGAKIYDSSCSEAAKVLYADKDEGYFVKCASKGELLTEKEMAEFFWKKGFGVEVMEYVSKDKDYLVTRRAKGEDATHQNYLDNPKRLCDVLGEGLRMLHQSDKADCPVQNRLTTYFETVKKNHEKGVFDASFINKSIAMEDAWKIACEGIGTLKCDSVIHGDYCLPNIVLEGFKPTAFIDVGNGGIGDRHIDLFWGAWSLWYNLKTDKYRQRFFDAYGRDMIDEDIIRLVEVMECFG